MVRRSGLVPLNSDDTEPRENVTPFMPPGASAPATGDAGVQAEGDLPALPETDDSGVSLPPETLRQMAAAEEARREIVREFIGRNLKVGVDYGTIMTGRRESKPSLFKPGAEKMCLLFGLRSKFNADRATLVMAGNPPGLFAYVCRLIDRQGRIVGEGRGAADLTERNGWTVNNAIKICEKRAQVDAILRVGGISEIFTQDLEDMDQRGEPEAAPRRPAQTYGEAAPAPRSAPEAPAPRAAAPAAPAPRPTLAEPPPAPRRPAEADDLCTDQQQQAIRGLLPRAGLSERELTTKLGVAAISDLTRGKAARVIERLTVNARDRGQQAAG
jgi:hypothetical protein